MIVSVSCITYNHAPYIRQCLEGILMQETDFDVEVLIHDDASTDGTRAIIKEYVDRFPDKIFPVYQDVNQYQLGVRGFMVRFNFPRAKGKYIALCEGDDYWTDPGKLQKQVAMMEQYPDCAICFHDMRIEGEDGLQENITTNPNQKLVSDIHDLATKGNFIWTASAMLRNSVNTFPEWYFKSRIGDFPMHMLHAMHGNIRFISDVMGVYRIHEGGVLSQKSRSSILSNWLDMLKLMNEQFSADVNRLLQHQTHETMWRLYLIHAGENNAEKASMILNQLTEDAPFFVAQQMKSSQARLDQINQSRLVRIARGISRRLSGFRKK